MVLVYSVVGWGRWSQCLLCLGKILLRICKLSLIMIMVAFWWPCTPCAASCCDYLLHWVGKLWKFLEALEAFGSFGKLSRSTCVLCFGHLLCFVLCFLHWVFGKTSCRVWTWLLHGKLSVELEVDQFGCQISSPRMRLRGTVTVVAHGVIMCFASLAEGVVFSDVISSAREVFIFSTASWR